MEEQKIPTGETPEVWIESAAGDLYVKGWDRAEVSVRSHRDETVTLESADDVIRIRSAGTCTVRLPQGANLRVGAIHGNAHFKLLVDQLSIESVQGSLTLRHVGEVEVSSLHGNLFARDLSGSFRAGKLAGNASLRGIQGDCEIERLDGNLDLRDLDGALNVDGGGNAQLRLDLIAADSYTVRVDGNLFCRIPENASVRLNLSSGGQIITLDIPGQRTSLRQEAYELSLGEGEVEMNLAAGGTLTLASRGSAWVDTDSFEADFGDEPGENFAPGREGISDSFSEQFMQQIESQVTAQMAAQMARLQQQMTNLSDIIRKAGMSEAEAERVMRRARETTEQTTAKAQENIRRVQEKIERRAEAAQRKAERARGAARRYGGPSTGFSVSYGANPPPAAEPAREPATDEERLMILRMLEQKKITLEEAEQLLTALEGKA